MSGNCLNLLLLSYEHDPLAGYDCLQRHDFEIQRYRFNHISRDYADFSAFHLVGIDGLMPPDSILELLQTQQNKETNKFIIFNLQENIHNSVNYLQAGARGILTAKHEQQEVADIFKAVHQGVIYIDNDVAQKLAMRHIKKILEPFDALSSREFDVFCLIAEDFPITYIANQLTISLKTVFNCQTAIRRKLNAQDNDQFKLIAKNNGLI
ncbi:LuxR C-terminal-related transcriptional regulator [Methylicorpusculum sp.]|uniref:LuxR C-terminal-related transcriptional regulator n=1 Tax=Methylicorpusculum sp. TaxID=2713644 RepID=UPI00272FCE28|nr:LuxR C-terminal-related transcriptional regulator [Methylicorpusculum sp.]MDP2178573.1 LuxR C-terminal-related transcriptional regulator [Methylicorpusculum sp.]MDP3530598.1 LuxR C-terminal-related transcriptional regulator [Methylicorpusculum sp.]MDZ4152099.1 LuxR C-terminal-related transcriptional regulator [Methylicorpusculum sp.]